MSFEINLGKHKVGQAYPPYFIADIAANHDGSLERAKRLIDLAAKSGANATKFQHFRAETIVSRKGFTEIGDRIAHQKAWNKNVFDVYKEVEVPLEWTALLASHAQNLGIDFFTAPYDLEAINYVDKYVMAFKVGSGDIDWLESIKLMASKGKPMIIATGASTIKDVDLAVETVRRIKCPLVLMQCNTNYTGDHENLKFLNLNVLSQYRERYDNIVLGLSDHTPGYLSVLGSVALGARVIEKHFTDDTSRPGPDHYFSLNPEVWKEMVLNSNRLFESLGDGVKKIEENEVESAIVQRRALRFKRDMRTGEIISEQDLIPLRPAVQGSLKPIESNLILGKTLKYSVEKDDLVKLEMFL